MTESLMYDESMAWKRFLKRHWGAALVAGTALALALVGSILVLLWYAGEAQAGGLVPEGLGAWSMGNLVDFLLRLVFWEIIFIAVPVAIAAIVAWAWWKRLPAEERAEYEGAKMFGKGSKRSDAGNGLSFLLFLVFILKVYLDGNWDLPFADWTFDYLVNSVVWAFVAVLIVFGIPALIGGLWWLRRQMRHVP